MARLIFEIPPITKNGGADLSRAYAAQLASWYENSGEQDASEWVQSAAMTGNYVLADIGYPGGPIQGSGDDIIVYLQGQSNE